MADWFVAPLGAGRGTKDGTSYATAWEGLATVTWGTGGVIAGDTLWIVDDHRDYAVSASGALTVGSSGSLGQPITVRGDYPEHAATVGLWTHKQPVGTSWELVQTGVYRKNLSGNATPWAQNEVLLPRTEANSLGGTAVAVQALSRANPCVVTWVGHGLATNDVMLIAGVTQAQWSVLNAARAVTWIDADHFSIGVDTSAFALDYDAAGDAGTIKSCMPTSAQLTALAEGTTYSASSGPSWHYIKLAEGADPTSYDMMIVLGGPAVIFSGQSYVDVKNLTFSNGGFAFSGSNSNITIDNVVITSADTGVSITGGLTTLLTVSNSQFSYCADGFYSQIKTVANLRIDGCSFSNIVTDYRTLGDSVDHHCIGLMGGTGIVICDCTFDNAETGVTLYSGIYNAATDCEVYRCVASNMYRDSVDSTNPMETHGCGFDVHVNGASYDKITFKVHDNIAIGCESCGIRVALPTNGQENLVQVWNNTIYGCQIGIQMTSGDTNTDISFTNNIIAEPTDFDNGLPCVFLWSADANKVCDYNCYYSSGSALFYAVDGSYYESTPKTFTQWKEFYSAFDAHSITSDPQFINAGTNFHLHESSDCINAGMNSGLLFDFDNAIRPVAAYDIGAYEYHPIESRMALEFRHP